MGYHLNFGAVWRSFDLLLSGLGLGLAMAIISIFAGCWIGLAAAFAPGDSLGLLILALMLLGLGWNFGLIAGTALVVDATVPAN